MRVLTSLIRPDAGSVELLGSPFTRRDRDTTDSHFETHLPLFSDAGVGCLSWGLVAGRTQTFYSWGSPPGAPEPATWYHDIYRADGTPYDEAEVELIRRVISEARVSPHPER